MLDLPTQLFPNFNFKNCAATGVATHDLTEHLQMLIPNVLTWTLEPIITALYYISEILVFAIAVIIAAMAPVIFLSGGILNIGLVVGTFVSLPVILRSWPIVFAVYEGMHSTRSYQSGDFSEHPTLNL